MKILRHLSILLLVVVIVSCSSIVSGTKQKVSVTTNPNAAVVITSSSGVEFYNGSAPVEIKLPRKNEYSVKIQLEGFQEENVLITKSFNTWYIGNLCFGGIIGFVVDAVNGAMWNLEPEVISIDLKTASNGKTEETFAVFRAIDDNGELRTLVIPMIKKG